MRLRSLQSMGASRALLALSVLLASSGAAYATACGAAANGQSASCTAHAQNDGPGGDYEDQWNCCVTFCVTRVGATQVSVDSVPEVTASRTPPPAPPVSQYPTGPEPIVEYDPVTQNWYRTDCFSVCGDVTASKNIKLTISVPDPCGGSTPITYSHDSSGATR